MPFVIGGAKGSNCEEHVARIGSLFMTTRYVFYVLSVNYSPIIVFPQMKYSFFQILTFKNDSFISHKMHTFLSESISRYEWSLFRFEITRNSSDFLLRCKFK